MSVLDSVPQEWQPVIADIFNETSPVFVELANTYGPQLRVGETSVRNINGRIQKECSHYSTDTKMIYMDENKDPEEYAETFRHEYGHFMDDILGRISMSDNFGFALEADRYWLDNSKTEGTQNFSAMLDDLSSTDAVHSRYISDILSGVFLNDTKIRKTYYSLGLPFYGHDTNDYWLSWPAEEKIIEKETFANLYALYLKGEQADIAFVERWFPNVTMRFKTELEGVVHG